MRGRKNLLRSASNKTTVSDLITNSENALSSQATVISSLSQRAPNTINSQQYQEFQDYEQVIGDDSQSLRISPEEQRRIQEILELARKGKINPANAFSVPVRVADPQLGQGQNMRFWKFASQLLYASMGIYDKRVQHVFQGTHRMFDSLLRVTNNKSAEPEEQGRRQRGEIIKIDITQLQQSTNLMSFDFQKFHTEDPSRINLKKSILGYNTDPLFSKKLQAFDSDSLKCLFVNVFETGTNGQITFFHSTQKISEVPSQKMKHEVIEQVREQDSEEQTETQCEKTKTLNPSINQQTIFQQFPSFIQDQLSQFNFISKSLLSYEKITNYKAQNLRQPLSNYLTQDFSLQIQQNQPILQYNKQQLYIQPLDNFSTQLQNNSMTQPSNFINSPHGQFQKQFSYHVERNPFITITEEDQEPFSYMTPWELEFKGSKLHKRIKRNAAKTDNNRNQSRNKRQDEEIDFFREETLTRKDILASKFSMPKQNNQKVVQKFLVPKSINNFRKKQKQTFKSARNSSKFLMTAQPHHHTSSKHLQGTQYLQVQNQNHQYHSQQQNINPNRSEQLTQYNTYSYQNRNLRNIRQVKHNIYENLSRQRILKISDIDIGLTPASALVVLLHLANQNSLVLKQMEENSDLSITFQA